MEKAEKNREVSLKRNKISLKPFRKRTYHLWKTKQRRLYQIMPSRQKRNKFKFKRINNLRSHKMQDLVMKRNQ